MSPDDLTEKLVVRALEEEGWDFRTVDGIANEISQPPNVVREVLQRLLPNVVRVSTATDKLGRTLYTLRAKPVTARERFATVLEAAGLPPRH